MWFAVLDLFSFLFSIKKRQVVGHASWASVVAAVVLPLWSKPRWISSNFDTESEATFDRNPGESLLSAQHGCGFWANVDTMTQNKPSRWINVKSIWNQSESTFSSGFHSSRCFRLSIILSLRSNFRPRSIPYIWPGRRDGQGEMKENGETPLVKHNSGDVLKLLLTMFSLFATHKLKSCSTTVGSSPGEPNCHMLDEEWRGQHVSCNVFWTEMYPPLATTKHPASHFANLTGTCMRQLPEVEMCGACRKLKDVRMWGTRMRITLIHWFFLLSFYLQLSASTPQWGHKREDGHPSPRLWCWGWWTHLMFHVSPDVKGCFIMFDTYLVKVW